MATKIRKPTKTDPLKGAAAARRKAHFEAGGTLAMWRGAATTFRDRKKVADRKACRGKVRYAD